MWGPWGTKRGTGLGQMGYQLGNGAPLGYVHQILKWGTTKFHWGYHFSRGYDAYYSAKIRECVF